MKSPYDGDPPLTDEQQAVVDLPADTMTLVTAGPGAGKTHTLVRRIEHLSRRDRLGAGEILVLTFSRAAVRELKRRLVERGENGRYVRVQTFDAWALELLITVDAHEGWQARPFEDRIDAAARWIGSEAVNELLNDLKHVIVDEVQDLVGPRRKMVERLLATYDCGFTVVGDPAQSIYGFQIANTADQGKETNQFVRWLRQEFGSDLVERHLTHNFRAVSEEAQAALHLGELLQASAESKTVEPGAELFKKLWQQLKDVDALGSPADEFVCQSLLGYPGTTAILSHTNGQALLVSESLHQHGVEHTVQRRAQDRAAPAWLAGLFRQDEGVIISQAKFSEFMTAAGIGGETRALWNLLMKTIHSRQQTLDLSHVRAMLAEGRLPDELSVQPPASIVVSSVHRAKGLEFDRVLVVDPGPVHTYRENPVDLAEAARMLYVALTRPRTELWRLDDPVTFPLRLTYVDSADRWGRFHRRNTWMRLGLELGTRDVLTEQPAGNDRGLTHASQFTAPAATIQDYLHDKIRPGDDVMLERLPDTFDPPNGPQYLITHGRFPIGVTSSAFSRAAATYIGWSRWRDERRWPATVTGVRIDSVETVTGSISAGSAAGLGAHGIWLAPRLVGLSRFKYADFDSEG